jgi:hypothetical protein
MTQGSWNQPGAYSAWQPPPPAWPTPPPPILGTPMGWTGRVRPKASGSVTLPIVGALLVILCLLLLPWVHAGDKWFLLPQITSNMRGGATGIGAWYVSGWCYPLAFFAILYAFAANLDSPTFRWLHFGFMVPVPLFLFGMILIIGNQHSYSVTGKDLGRNSINGEAIVVAFGLLALAAVFFALAFAKRIVIRVIGGLMMLGYLLIHTAAVIDLLSKKVDLLPFAFAASLGYLLCAVGAFIGPRYIPSLR